MPDEGDDVDDCEMALDGRASYGEVDRVKQTPQAQRIVLLTTAMVVPLGSSGLLSLAWIECVPGQARHLLLRTDGVVRVDEPGRLCLLLFLGLLLAGDSIRGSGFPFRIGFPSRGADQVV